MSEIDYNKLAQAIVKAQKEVNKADAPGGHWMGDNYIYTSEDARRDVTRQMEENRQARIAANANPTLTRTIRKFFRGY